MDITFALSVIFTGVVIVFIVLIALILVMVLLGAVAGEKKQTKPVAPVAPVAPKAAPVAPVAPQAVAQDGIEEEVVAVISAAIAAFTDSQGTVTSITRAKQQRQSGGRSAWSLAGLRENTTSF